MENGVFVKQRRQGLGFFTNFTVFNILAFIIVISTLSLLVSKWYFLAGLPAVSLIVFSALMRSPKTFLYIIIFLIPFNAFTNLVPDSEGVTIPKIIGILLILVVFIQSTIMYKSPLPGNSSLWRFFGFFLIISLFSSLWSDFPSTSFNDLRKLLTSYLMFYLCMYFFSSEDVKDKLPKVFAISVSISALLSIVGYLFNISILSLETYSLKRATGAEQDPNFLASMLIFSLPFISHYIFLARGVLNRGFWMCLFFINMAAIILTYSRSGSLVTAVVFILLIRTYYHYLNLRKLGFAVIGVFVALSVFISSVPSSYWDRVGSVTNIQTDRSLGRRTSYLGVAKEQFFENPLLGSGPGTFRDYYGQSMEAIAFQKEGKTNKRPAHNVYLEVLIGTGAIGLLCYLGLLYFVLRLFKKARLNFLKIHNIELVSLTNAYCTALLGLLCYSLFLSNLYHDYIWLSLAAAQMLFNLSKEYTLVEEKA